jgi:putative membrane protein
MNTNQKTIARALIIGAVAVFLIGGWWMGSPMWGTGMMSRWGGMGLGMGFFWILFLLGLFILFSDRYSPRNEDHAKTILRERFARGELSEEEFEEMMKKL